MSPHSYYFLVSTMYEGLTAFRVLSWVPPRVICWIGKESHIPEEYQDILKDHLLYLFEDKADSNPKFLL